MWINGHFSTSSLNVMMHTGTCFIINGMSPWNNSSYFVTICLSTDYMYDIMRWSFYSRMIGRNKYLECLFALDNTFKNYIMDKYHPVSFSNHSVKNDGWLYFEYVFMFGVVFSLLFLCTLLRINILIDWLRVRLRLIRYIHTRQRALPRFSATMQRPWRSLCFLSIPSCIGRT